MMCGSGLPGLPAMGCLPTCPPAAEAQTSPLPGPQCASSVQRSPKNLSASANPPAPSHPSTHSIVGCQNNPHTSSQQFAVANQAGSIALGLSPMRHHLPRTSLCHNTGVMSSYLKPTLPPKGRWRVSLPQVVVSHRCHSPFNEQPVLWLQGGGLLCSDTCWKARNH